MLLFTFLMFSCKKEEEKLSFSEVQITTNSNTLVEVFIPKASGNTIISKAINTKIENFIASLFKLEKADTLNKPASLTQQIDAFNKEYQNFSKIFPETTQQWEAQIDGEVIFQSKDIISIAITAYLNTGGAHGNTTITFLNFEASTGKQILKENLFTDIEAFKIVTKPYFDNTVSDTSILLDPEVYELPQNIGFSEEGVILLYNTYEIAPYATGVIEFIVPFEKANEYLVFKSF